MARTARGRKLLRTPEMRGGSTTAAITRYPGLPTFTPCRYWKQEHAWHPMTFTRQGIPRMSLLYDLSANAVRRLYDARIDTPPVLHAGIYFPMRPALRMHGRRFATKHWRWP